MITTPTVLILGAGASMPFGFPSGGKLKSDISNLSESQIDQLVECGFDRRHVLDFVQTLRRSPLNSVDIFLERRSEFIEVGKHAIAQQLIPKEDPESPDLFAAHIASTNEQNWYHYLFNRIDASLDKFHLNNLTIVTFNYDRSFEAFLHSALMDTHGIDHAQATTFACTIPVIHVHGQLGLLGWQSPKYGTTTRRSYSRELNPDTIKCGAIGIKIIHQAGDDLTVFREAQAYIESSKRVLFLGFGYHPVNMERLLSSAEILPKNGVGGSFCGFTALEMEALSKRGPKSEYWIHPAGPHDCKVCDFLRNTYLFRTD